MLKGAMGITLPHVSRKLALAGALLIVATLFGGGGSPAPRTELVVQLASLTLLALWIWRVSASPASYREDWLALGFGILLISSIIVQLVPLPPTMWQALPGRQIVIDSLALTGSAERWWPISVAPDNTLASLLSLIPPLTMLFFVTRLNLAERERLLALLVVLAIVSALVGMGQVAGGPSALRSSADRPVFATGFFANRNAAADFFAIGLIATFAMGKVMASTAARRLILVLKAVAAVLLTLGVMVTGSRTGTLLIAAIWLGGVILLIARSARPSRKQLLVWGVPIVGLAAVLLASLASNPVLERTFDRYTDLEDARPALWEDTRYSIEQSWPIGTGVGSFVPVVTAVERLEVVDRGAPNRAHNDYLEFTLETGLFGPLFLIALAIALVLRSTRILKTTNSRTRARQVAFALAALGVLGLHSIVDYPMRAMTLAVLAALAFGLVSRDVNTSGESNV